MMSANDGCGCYDDVNGWAHAAFAAERAPARGRLPAPAAVEVPPRARRVPAVRASFVLMLALSVGALLIHL